VLVLSLVLTAVTTTHGTAAADAAACPSQQNEIGNLSRKAGVVVPLVGRSPYKTSAYRLADQTILLHECASADVIAHEFGHYVTHLAAKGKESNFRRLSYDFTQRPNWIRMTADQGGWERAAHCVGYVLGGRGVYTRCPDAELRALARTLVRMAAQNAPLLSAEAPTHYR